MADTSPPEFIANTKRIDPPLADRANQAFSPPMTPEQIGGKGLDDVPSLPSSPIVPTNTPSDINIPDNYVTHTLANQKHRPPITLRNVLQNINWVSFLVLTVTPTLAIYGCFSTAFNWKTALWSVIYYFVTGLGITAGYHRLWAHRSYNAAVPLEYALSFAGAGAVQGSIKWWSRGHRAHHRYTDTKLDPYSAHEGFWWAHVGWMIFKPRTKIGVADISDLTRNKVVRWQHKHYLPLMIFMGFIFPTAVAGFGWGDWRGGYFFAGAARLTFVHHSTFCVNSLAHWLGEAPFDNKHTPRDHFITALCTVGEGYHNFHHQFPMDFRNAIKWFQYDPTKWFISTMALFGLASHLKKFPDNEIKKGQYTMKLQRLAEESGEITWPTDSNHLPVISWDDFKAEAKERSLVVVGGFIHDVSSFTEEHPGGAHLIKRAIGTDATTAFMGGVYDHSRSAQNLLAMMRVGVLYGGMEVEHLKSRPFESPASTASPSIASSASSSSENLVGVARMSKQERELELELDSYRNSISSAEIEKHKTYDKTTLHIPPSEMLVIARSTPRRRPGFQFGGDIGSGPGSEQGLSRSDSLVSVTQAQRIGELGSLNE
jgi:stearoyl-CoA desaturase (delta-9 desaturase)